MSATGLKVTFLGLGNMGNAIAQNILKKGFPLVVWSRTAAKADVNDPRETSQRMKRPVFFAGSGQSRCSGCGNCSRSGRRRRRDRQLSLRRQVMLGHRRRCRSTRLNRPLATSPLIFRQRRLLGGSQAWRCARERHNDQSERCYATGKTTRGERRSLRHRHGAYEPSRICFSSLTSRSSAVRMSPLLVNCEVSSAARKTPSNVPVPSWKPTPVVRSSSSAKIRRTPTW